MESPETIFLCAAVALVSFGLGLYWRREYFRAREEIDRQREETDVVIEFLHKTAEDIGSAGEPSHYKSNLYKRIVRATALSCGAMSACLYEKLPDGQLKAMATEGLFPPQSKKIPKQKSDILRSKFLEDALAEEILAPNSGIVGRVAAEKRGILVKRAEKDTRAIKHEDESLKIRSLIAVPVIFSGKLYGVLAVANPISGCSFTRTDFSLARSLGEQAGLALHNIEAVSALILKNKMEFDLRLASGVQQYLLPAKLANTENLEFAVKYFPQQLIGGDFYDFIELPDGKLGIVVGDVSGKGVSAAIIMAICQTKLRYIARGSASPSDTLRKLNAEMVVAMRSDMFISMVYAVIDSNASKITLARAGHEPALLYRAATGKTEKIRSGGMALGMVAPDIFDETMEDVSFDFARGDIFTLYTDGITEAADPDGNEYTTAKLAEEVAAVAAKNAADINNEIIADVERFMKNSTYADDLTLVTIKHI